MNKKVLSLVLALAIVLGSFGTVALASNTEVAYNSQAQKIQWLIDNNHVEGRKVNADGSADLALEDNVTRAEITKLLVHLLGKADLADVLKGVMRPFPDVTIEHWANGYVSVATTTRANAANDNRIVIGYPDGKFYPENNVTYAELATMLVRIAKDDLTTKMEADSIWATSYMRWAEEEGILEGLTITNSDKAITRADAFEMIYNTFFKMGSVNEVNFGDDLGIVSRLGNGEIQLNQDAKRVYKIDANTLLTDGTGWVTLSANIDRANRGSLVRLIVDKDGRVSHLIELGNPKDLALENARWYGVAKKVVETRPASTNVEAINAKLDVVSGKYVDLTIGEVRAEINNSTRIFVADVKNNALREVKSVTDAFNLFGKNLDKLQGVYMGYDDFAKHNEAKVIVFNSVENYFGEKETVRITGDLNSLYRFEAENTKGVKKAYDVSNLPLFPTNDLLDPMDVVEITDNENVQFRTDLIKIDYSENDVYKVEKVEDGNRRITLSDKYNYQAEVPVSRDVLVFLEGQLKAGVNVQVDINKGVIEIISVVDKAVDGILTDGVRVGSGNGYIVRREGNVVTIADRIKVGNEYRFVNHKNYEVDDTDLAFVNNVPLNTQRIVFDIASKFGNTDYIYNVANYGTPAPGENIDKAAAAAVDALILKTSTKIDDVTIAKDKQLAKEARDAYEDLTKDQKDLVTELAHLERVEYKLKELAQEAAKAMIASITLQDLRDKTPSRWLVSIDRAVPLKDNVESLKVRILDGERVLAENIAKDKVLTSVDTGEITSPFYLDGPDLTSGSWEQENVLAGEADSVEVELVIDGVSYIVTN